MRLWKRRFTGGRSAISPTGIIHAVTSEPQSLNTFSAPGDYYGAAIGQRDVTYYLECDIHAVTYNGVFIGLRDTVNTSRYTYATNSGVWLYYYDTYSSGGHSFGPGDTVGVKIRNERLYLAVNGSAFKERAFYDGYNNARTRLFFSVQTANNSLTVRLDSSTFKYPQAGCAAYPLS